MTLSLTYCLQNQCFTELLNKDLKFTLSNLTLSNVGVAQVFMLYGTGQAIHSRFQRSCGVLSLSQCSTQASQVHAGYILQRWIGEGEGECTLYMAIFVFW